MYNSAVVRPVTPALVPQWLEFKAEYIERVEDAAEQAACISGAMATMQRLIDAPVGTYTSEDQGCTDRAKLGLPLEGRGPGVRTLCRVETRRVKRHGQFNLFTNLSEMLVFDLLYVFVLVMCDAELFILLG